MKPTKEQQLYIEEVGLYFEQTGLTRTAGRILGWLLISEPPQQTMNELVDALQVSKSSISTASRTLIQIGLVHRISLPGERRDYYRMSEGVWKSAFSDSTSQVTALRELADKGLRLIAERPAQQKGRLQEMRDFYAFFEEEFPRLIERWEEKQNSKESSDE